MEVNGVVHRTALTARVRDLVRGEDVPLRLCGPGVVPLDTRGTLVRVRPTGLLRPDALTFERERTDVGVPLHQYSLDLERDDAGAPCPSTCPAGTGRRC